MMTRIIQPTVAGMKQRGMPYSGVLYAGLMVVNGEPYLIEYNARFGDPECQTLMMRLDSDLVDLLQACAQSRLNEVKDQVKWSDDIALCVVMATQGYPGSYPKNTPIRNLEHASTLAKDTVIFHAGTAKGEKDQIVSTGGRVLGITAKAPSVTGARDSAYKVIEGITWPDGFYRKDIAWRAL